MTNWAALDPYDERAGTFVYMPTFFYVVKHAEGVVLFDSGYHPALATDPEARIGDAAAVFQVEIEADDDLTSTLGRIGLKPSDVDLVIQSHLHFDHAGGLGELRQAEVMVQGSELAFARNPPLYQRDLYVQDDFADPINWVELDGDRDVFGDGRLQIVQTPGHTAGHQSLMVHLDSQSLFLLADAAYLLSKMRERILPVVLWNPDVMMDSWDRIEELEKEHDAFLITTHDIDFRERLKLAPESWYE